MDASLNRIWNKIFGTRTSPMPSLPILRSAEITEPCQENWEEMAPSARGRHCASCNKTVLDFAAMTMGQVVEAVEASQGSLCARVSRDQDGRIVTLPTPAERSRMGKAAGFVLASVLMGSAAAQTATLSGRAVMAKTIDPDEGSASSAEVLLVQNGSTVASTKADATGRWNISVPAGRYDLVVRRNAMVGERVNDAELHAGNQEFPTMALRFNPGHLQSLRDGEVTVFVGEVIASYRYPISYLFKHPLLYLKHLPHNFG